MKTVKDVSEIAGVSIRTLRYIDDIGLLKPTELTEAGYRLYNDKALEKLQEIMFYGELEIPLSDIKIILENPFYDKKQALLTQKALLEQKRNRLNGIIELISDVVKGVNTMSFEAFSKEEIEAIVEHTLAHMSPEGKESQIKQFGSEEKYRAYLIQGFQNEKAVNDILRWYGSKEKVLEAILESDVETSNIEEQQNTNELINQKFVKAKEQDDSVLAEEAVKELAELYKDMFKLDNSRNILLDLAYEFVSFDKMKKVTDEQYGEGAAEYIAKAIKRYYGIKKEEK